MHDYHIYILYGIMNCYSTGNVMAATGSTLGGFAGSNVPLSNSFVAGVIASSHYDTASTVMQGGTAVTAVTDGIGTTSGTAQDITQTDLKAATTLTDWSTDDWIFGNITQYPTLRASTGNREILCGQGADRVPPDGDDPERCSSQ